VLLTALAVWIAGIAILSLRLRRYFTDAARASWSTPRPVLLPDLARPHLFIAAGQRLRLIALAWAIGGAAAVVVLYVRQ
jgi:hypothetical protein